MQTRNKVFDDISQLMTNAMGVAQGARDEAETAMKSMIDRWGEILDETERILNGERLLPFWRGTTKQGVNLRRVFEEPRTFDFVLWAQGSGAGPYLEDGEVTSRQFWRETQQVFSGRLWWFSFWVN